MNNTESVRLNKAKTLLREAQGALMHGATLNILRPGQKILADAGVRETQDLEVAKRMIEQGCNIGMKPGPRLLIIDVDVKAGDGIESWKHLTRRGLPDTRKVITPSGGFHCYYTLPPNIERIKAIHPDYPHIDFLSGGHNVVLGGSTVSGNCYEVVNNVKAAPAPDWLVKMIDNSSDSNTFGIMEPGSLDIEELKNLLAQINPEGMQYQDWVNVGFAIHHEMRGDEDGLGRGLKLWHEWSSRSSKYEGERGRTDKVWNSSHADRPGAITIGTIRRMVADTAVNEFTALDKGVEVGDTTVEPDEFDDTEFRVTNEFMEVLPAGRDWLLKDLIIRGYVGGLTGRGGSAKSTAALLAALSIATGRDLLGFGSVKRGRVMFVSNEESNDEFKLRLLAAMMRWSISIEDLGDRLYFKSGYANAVSIAEGTFDMASKTTRIKPTKEWMELDTLLVRGDFDALILDPLANMLINVEENDNVSMTKVMEILRRSAWKNDLGILVVHHSNKGGTTADPDGSARGASAIVNSLRCLLTMTQCNPKMMEKLQVPEGTEHLYIQLAGGKSNLGSRRGYSYLKLSIQVVMAEIKGKVAGEHVATLEPVPDSLMEPVSFHPGKAIIEFIIQLGCEAISKNELVDLLIEDPKYPSFKSVNPIWKHITEAISEDQSEPTEVHGFKLWIGRGRKGGPWSTSAKGVFVQKVND